MKELLKKLAIKYHLILSDEEKQLEQEWLQYVTRLQTRMKQKYYESKIYNTTSSMG